MDDNLRKGASFQEIVLSVIPSKVRSSYLFVISYGPFGLARCRLNLAF